MVVFTVKIFGNSLILRVAFFAKKVKYLERHIHKRQGSIQTYLV